MLIVLSDPVLESREPNLQWQSQSQSSNPINTWGFYVGLHTGRQREWTQGHRTDAEERSHLFTESSCFCFHLRFRKSNINLFERLVIPNCNILSTPKKNNLQTIEICKAWCSSDCRTTVNTRWLAFAAKMMKQSLCYVTALAPYFPIKMKAESLNSNHVWMSVGCFHPTTNNLT